MGSGCLWSSVTHLRRITSNVGSHGLIQDVNHLYPVGGAILSTGMPGISGFRLPVVISDKLWESHQQYWESHPVLECQLSVPGGRATLSIGLPGSSSVSIKPSSDVYVLLLFLRKLHSRPSCALSRGHSGFSQQQKASVLPVWSSSQVKPWWRPQPGFWARSRSLRSRSRACGPAVWAKGNAATTEL